MEIISHSLVETEQLAVECLAQLIKEKRQTGKATTVGLIGNLGSGKTTFTQAVARVLGVTGRVTSPTFVIMKKYLVKESPWRNLVHIDCYRLENQKDLLCLGWDELVANPENLILVEWPERVGDLLSSPTLKIKFEIINETTRKIIYG